jgi:predicted TIM-barrel fold metal-dependent hydrolase
MQSALVATQQPPTTAQAIRVVDCDVHCQIDMSEFREYLAEPWRSLGVVMAGHMGYHNPVGVTRRDTIEEDGTCAAARPEGIARMLLDPYGIDIALLTGGMYGICVHPDPDLAGAVCTAYNNYMVDTWLKKDPRYRLAMIVPSQDPLYAAREIERIGAHPGIISVIISSASTAPLGQRQFHPIYAACEKMGLPLSLHPGNEGTGISAGPTAAGQATRYIEWHTGITQNFQAHVISMVTEGVFQKFPGLKVLLIEGGVSWIVPLMWRLDKNWKALRLTVPWLDRLPSKIIEEHIRFTTQPIEEPENHAHLKQLFSMFDAERMLVFSSDFPHWDGDTPDFALRGFSETFKRRVWSENAVELFGL